jgi:tetratricopeptide (TPR) repeat protein
MMAVPILLLGLILNPFLMQASFAILGSVRVGEGGAAGAVRVSLLNDNYQTLRTILVDASGRFQFRGLNQGVYLVKVESTSGEFEEQTQRVEFQAASGRRGSAEEVFPVDFILRRKKNQPRPEAPGVVFAQTVPESARAEYERGLKKIKDNKSEQAIPFLQRAIEIFPDYYLALELLGTEYVKADNPSEAVPLLTRALAVNEAAPKSLYALGVAYLKLNRLPDAETWLRKAVAQDGKNANAHLMLGIAQGRAGRLEEAEASLKTAYRLGGELVPDVHLYLAGIYDKQKKYGEAVRELELFLKEGKDLDESKVKAMIAKLRTKAESEQRTP